MASNDTNPFAYLSIPEVLHAGPPPLRGAIEPGSIVGHPALEFAAIEQHDSSAEPGHGRPWRGKVQVLVLQSTQTVNAEIVRTHESVLRNSAADGRISAPPVESSISWSYYRPRPPSKFGSEPVLFCNPPIVSVSWRRSSCGFRERESSFLMFARPFARDLLEGESSPAGRRGSASADSISS